MFFSGVSEPELLALESKMKSLSRAYSVLSDSRSRRIYDQSRFLDIDDFFDQDHGFDSFFAGLLSPVLDGLDQLYIKLMRYPH